MKKLFLVIAAFTCMPTYTGDNRRNNNNDSGSSVGGFLFVSFIVIGGYYGSQYIYDNYWNVPTNDIPQPTNTSTSENDNEAPQDNNPVVTPPINNPFIPVIEKMEKQSNEIKQAIAKLEKIKKQKKAESTQLSSHHEQLQEQAPLKDEPVAVITPVVEKVIEKMKAEKEQETPWHHNKNLIKMMYDI